MAMDAILFVSGTGCQWNDLNMTVICSSCSAHCDEFCQHGLMTCDYIAQADWSRLSLDHCVSKTEHPYSA